MLEIFFQRRYVVTNGFYKYSEAVTSPRLNGRMLLTASQTLNRVHQPVPLGQDKNDVLAAGFQALSFARQIIGIWLCKVLFRAPDRMDDAWDKFYLYLAGSTGSSRS